MATCQHKSVFLDEDETKCRTCSASITFPRRAPALDDRQELKRDIRTTAGEKRRTTPVEDQEFEVQEVNVQEVQPSQEIIQQEIIQDEDEDQEVLRERQGTDTQTSPSTPSLACTCCKLTLPLEAFSQSMKAINRAFRAWRCRSCAAFASRVKREANPDEIRQKARERRVRMLDAMTPEQRELAKLKRQGIP